MGAAKSMLKSGFHIPAMLHKQLDMKMTDMCAVLQTCLAGCWPILGGTVSNPQMFYTPNCCTFQVKARAYAHLYQPYPAMVLFDHGGWLVILIGLSWWTAVWFILWMSGNYETHGISWVFESGHWYVLWPMPVPAVLKPLSTLQSGRAPCWNLEVIWCPHGFDMKDAVLQPRDACVIRCSRSWGCATANMRESVSSTIAFTHG